MNLLEIMALLKLNSSEYKKGLQDAERDAESSGGKIGSFFGGAAKAVIAGITAAAAAVGALMSQSIAQYAEYEQLQGGAELLFGDAYDYVADKAANAYATVQMSANDYLTQVNGLSTGLKTALGGNAQAAAELADRVVTAEADVVAATGASQEAVQSAFNGIMKSNYTMLDNLQLGIKPTKEGMQEVIDKVNEWNAANGEATSYQIENLADCQSALVDYIEMQGLADYAANEAADTLQGSLASTKAAWQNLLVGLSDSEADLEMLIGGLVTSATALFSNLMPVAKQALSGIGQAIRQILPVAVQQIPGILTDVLPELLAAGMEMIRSIIEGVQNSLPELVPMVVEMIEFLVNSLGELLPMLVEASVMIITELANGLSQNLNTLIPAVVSAVLAIVNALISNVPLLIPATIQLMLGLANGLIAAIPELLSYLPQIISSLVSYFVSASPQMIAGAIAIIGQLAMGLISQIPALVSKIPQIITAIKTGLNNGISQIKTVGGQLIQGLWNGINDKLSWLKTKLKTFMDSCMDAIKSFFGIASPSKRFREIGNWCVLGFNEGLAGLADQSAMQSAIDSALNGLNVDGFNFGLDGNIGGMPGLGGTVYNQTINVNREIATADELARAVRVESRYGLMLGRA